MPFADYANTGSTRQRFVKKSGFYTMGGVSGRKQTQAGKNRVGPITERIRSYSSEFARASYDLILAGIGPNLPVVIAGNATYPILSKRRSSVKPQGQAGRVRISELEKAIAVRGIGADIGPDNGRSQVRSGLDHVGRIWRADKGDLHRAIRQSGQPGNVGWNLVVDWERRAGGDCGTDGKRHKVPALDALRHGGEGVYASRGRGGHSGSPAGVG
jgi:hypothetical protein